MSPQNGEPKRYSGERSSRRRNQPTTKRLIAASNNPSHHILGSRCPTVVGREVYKRVTSHLITVQNIHQLPNSPVHLFHSITIWAMAWMTFELRGRDNRRVHVQPGHDQQEGYAISMTSLQEFLAFLHQFSRHAGQVHRLLNNVIVPASKRLWWHVNDVHKQSCVGQETMTQTDSALTQSVWSCYTFR